MNSLELIVLTNVVVTDWSSLNDVPTLGGRQGFGDSLLLKSMTKEGGDKKIIQTFVTSFIDDPIERRTLVRGIDSLGRRNVK